MSPAGAPTAGVGLAILVCLCATPGPVGAAEWVRAGVNSDHPVWGLQGGLQFAVPPADKRSRMGGPRGLIRILSPVLPQGGYDLVNFIAVEPIVGGRRGYSELELSQLDGVRGKRIWPSVQPGQTAWRLEPGSLVEVTPKVQQLEVTMRVERFQNGAHVYLLVSQRSDAADEVRLAIHTEPDSAPLEYCILTATMGNKARARLLWLKDEVLSSLRLYADYRGDDFAPHACFGLERLYRTSGGDVLVALTTDEANPAAVFPLGGLRHWYYGGATVTQYWRKPAAAVRPDLSVAVNGRYTYWQTRQPIPGGVAFENFELRERFYEAQPLVFGVTRRTPEQCGFAARRGP